MLRKRINDEKDNWDLPLRECVFAYNTSVQSTTKFTPFYIMYGRWEPFFVFVFALLLFCEVLTSESHKHNKLKQFGE